MKKVLCPACGLMNLEKFVTFPHCAGCGTRLPVVAQESWFERWKRPLRAPLWATFVGLCCAGLAFWGITVTREYVRNDDRKLVAYVELPHTLDLGDEGIVHLQLDTTDADDSVAVQEFSEVRLRIADSTFADFNLISLTPQGKLSRQGSGRYYVFDTIGRDQPILIKLRPKRPGKGRVAFALYVQEYSAFTYQGTMKITRAKATPKVKPGQQFNFAH